MIKQDESLRVEWDNATGFDIHDRNMIYSNYMYFCFKDDKERADLEAKIMRSILAKLKLGQTVNLRQALMAGRRGEF